MNKREVTQTLDNLGVECRVMIQDVQSLIDKEKKLASRSDVSYFESYHTWEEVYDYIDSLAKEFPQFSSVSTIGQTYEGRDIKIITLSTDPSANKPTLWFDAGIHAREWIAVPTVTYIADTLLRGYGKPDGSNSTYLLDTYDVIVCPIINVDGYEYTWAEDRMWRKTRSVNGNNKCVGVDPNRNWDFHWGEAGTSPISCSDSYQGPSAASEVEVQIVQSYICDHKSIVGYINFHSYSQLWMSNWGYTDQLPPDYADQNGLSAAAVAAIKSVHGKTYEYGPIATTIYPASGSSADYTYGVCGVKYSYGVELRDTGEFGFLLPPEEIIPSGEEIFAAVVAMGQYIQAHP
eukprot:CAMPEP_0185024574 /NCGR_PEP_ID=MMETSP1103-20130426/7690_1 /TAXON_ID=36769 /ORGANISM="Paraphysomonas bandaiensis, Strain Caron Lab Isolate" /LENGTH=346 /DNA_ID=CAMNT_0027557581 /DNA_START=273 /DNA_END=1313 /DNA_ORIENTATION=+